MEAFCKFLDEVDDLFFAVALRVRFSARGARKLAVIATCFLLAPPPTNTSRVGAAEQPRFESSQLTLPSIDLSGNAAAQANRG